MGTLTDDHVGRFENDVRRLTAPLADPKGGVEDVAQGLGDANRITQEAISSDYRRRPDALPCVLGATSDHERPLWHVRSVFQAQWFRSSGAPD